MSRKSLLFAITLVVLLAGEHASAGEHVCLTVQPKRVTQAAGHPTGLELTTDTAKFWNKPALKVRFLNGDQQVRDKIAKWAKTWSSYASIQFSFVQAEPSHIRISISNDNKSWSYIGTDANSYPNVETMHFGWLTPSTGDDEYSRVVVHEFGHALGLIHEHQNPSGGIKWNRPAAYAYYKQLNGWTNDEVDRNVFDVYSSPTTNYSEVDAESIMMYPIPASITQDGWSAGWNTSQSAKDKKYISIIYPRATPIYFGNVVSNEGRYSAVHVGHVDHPTDAIWDTRPEGYVLAGRAFNTNGFWMATHSDYKNRTFYVGIVRNNLGRLYKLTGGVTTDLGVASWDSGKGFLVARQFDVNGFWIKME